MIIYTLKQKRTKNYNFYQKNKDKQKPNPRMLEENNILYGVLK